MIRIVCYMKYFIIWFSHAIAIGLVKSSRQFVYNIVKLELHYQINLKRSINIITRFLYQICVSDKNLVKTNIYMFRTKRRI